jgi:transcriptional regulator with XRE-family HTH domain
LLKRYRDARGLSQMDLALRADISARHLSYVETGRSQPSRDMIGRLADVLEASLAERNGLLLAAGYAPVEGPCSPVVMVTDDPQAAISLILNHHEPFPAIVLDPCWNVRSSNRAGRRFRRLMGCGATTEMNMLRLMMDPHEFRPRVVEWEEATGDLVRQLYRQVAANPQNEEMRALLAGVLSYPGVPAAWKSPDFGAPSPPLLSVGYRYAGGELRFYTTITTIAQPCDSALEDLRIECSFPVDAASAAACQALLR